MSNKRGGFIDLLYTDIMPKVYGIGAAVVILGAMFKILHLQGANFMIGLGLSTEAVIFFLSAFEPKHKELDWSRVYPELGDDYSGTPIRKAKKENGSVTQKLDNMLEKAKIGDDLIDSLGKGMRNLSESVTKISKSSQAVAATDEYSRNVQEATKKLTDLNKSYSSTAVAMNEMSEASKGAKEYQSQVQNVTKNLGALNAVYEMELKDANTHLKAMNKFYSNVTVAMENMAQASKETESFKNEMGKLTTNLTSLNKVYGNMLSAMKVQ